MAYAATEVVINEKIEKIFDFILDGRNNKIWRPGVKFVTCNVLEEISVGTVFIQEMKGPPTKKITADYKIIECDRYKKISFLILNGPYTPVGTFMFEELYTGVKVIFIMEEKNVDSVERTAHFQKVVDDIKNLKDYFNAQVRE